ncbi:MAG TPA: BON domain-containing protein [Blastocatellia bacterium]|nr:BON domain-containing protein [Blastocatellia bacterium]
MWSEGLICAACGEGLNPMMRVCPGCGQRLELRRPTVSSALDALSSATDEVHSESGSAVWNRKSQPAKEKPQGLPPLIAPPLRQETRTQKIPVFQGDEIVYVTPQEEPPRLPRFTPHQLTLMAIGAGFVIFSAIIALLLWNNHQREQARQAEIQAREQALMAALVTPDPALASTPAPMSDNIIAEAVRAALSAYNPDAADRYKFQVRDGVVTLDGYALSDSEKNGAENVIRAIPGARMLCSNLVVPAEPATPALPPVMVRLSDAEARKLDDALLRQLLEEQKNREAEAAQNQPRSQPTQAQAQATPDPPREAERLRREQELARQREEEAALRRQAEDRLKREAAEYEQRQEELRRAEAERRTRAEQARAETSQLLSGTVAWSGFVEGVDEIIISGSSASVRHVSGAPVREPRSSFSAPVPRAPVSVRLLSANGRGTIAIVQEPSAANGYVTIVRVDDSSKGGDKRYEFTLRWSAR